MSLKVLITGIAGLLGSHFSRHLNSKGYTVIGIDDFSGGYRENLAEGIQCSNIDLADLTAVDSFFQQERPDCVVHFAAYAAEGLSPFIRKYNYVNNLVCSANLITSSINYDVKKFIFTSSMAVYGAENPPPFTETMHPSPIDPYGIAKYAVEMDLKLAYEQFGLNYTVVRPHNVIGIYQNIWDRYRNVIGIWIRQAMHRQPLMIFGDGRQKRAFSDIAFYMEPFEKLLSAHNGEIFNLGADHEITILDMARLVQKCASRFGLTPELEFLEERHEAKYAYCSHEKAKHLLSFKDDTDLEQTIDAMFKWSLSQPDHAVKNMRYETNKKLYSFWK